LKQLTDIKSWVIRPCEIEGDGLKRWEELRVARPIYSSPFYSPKFVQLVARFRSDARVAIFELDGRIIGFLPFHLVRGGIGKPIGGNLNDYQGPILASDSSIPRSMLLKGAGLSAYDFDHLPTAICEGTCNSGDTAHSPQMNLADGYDSWFSRKDPSRKREFQNMMRKQRKMNREIGPVRFEFSNNSDELFEQHIRLRNELYRKSGKRADYCEGWQGEVLCAIREESTSDFCAVMSALYAGDLLVAAHFGIRSGSVLHWWFPAYNLAATKYSPGLNLINCCAMEGPEKGISLIDFGRGNERYKRQFANQWVELRAGSICLPGTFAAGLRRTCTGLLPLAERTLPKKIRSYPRRAISRLLWGTRLPKRISSEAVS